MKHFLLFSFLFFIISVLTAQITITDGDGNPINDGDIITFNTDGDAANLVVLITNNSSSQIELELNPVNITGANGSNMEFCVGSCYWGMVEGTIYPTGSTPFVIDAGSTTGSSEVHFHHHITDGDPDVTTYLLKLYESGNEAGNYIQFTYKYDANYVDVKSLNTTNTSIYPNPASNYFKLKVYQELIGSKIILTNILGKTVINETINSSIKTFDISNLNKGIYFYSIIKNNKTIETKKLIIK